jgi:hypothetical protein
MLADILAEISAPQVYSVHKMNVTQGAFLLTKPEKPEKTQSIRHISGGFRLERLGNRLKSSRNHYQLRKQTEYGKSII